MTCSVGLLQDMSELKAHSERPLAIARPETAAVEVGRLVRLSRAKRGMTRRQLAHASGASERYLAQIEAGRGNPSVIMLSAIADALELPIIELLPRANGRPAALARILDVLGRASASELPVIAELIEACAVERPAIDRARRIAAPMRN